MDNGADIILHRTQYEAKLDDTSPPWHVFVKMDYSVGFTTALSLGAFVPSNGFGRPASELHGKLHYFNWSNAPDDK